MGNKALREQRRILTEEGYVLDRQTKHEVWKHPDGRIVQVPHSPGDNHPRYLRKLRKTHADNRSR